MTNSQNRSPQTGQAPIRNNSKHKHSTTQPTNNKGAARKATFFEDNMKHNNTHRPATAPGQAANQPAGQCKENVAAPMKKANFTSARDTAAKSRNTNPHHNHHHHMKHYQPGRVSPRSPMSYVSPVGVSLSPPNTAFFASSKYLDAPSPKTLPAPPTKWITQEPPKRQLFDGTAAAAAKVAAAKLVAVPAISCSLASAAEVAGRSLCSDIFSQNLKLMLNVQS